jgi:UDP-glucuronate 4-epimerase
VNWGGDEAASIEEWCGFLSTLTGVPLTLAPTADTIDSVDIDLTRMHELVGRTTVTWKEGMTRMVRARHPELVAD